MRGSGIIEKKLANVRKILKTEIFGNEKDKCRDARMSEKLQF